MLARVFAASHLTLPAALLLTPPRKISSLAGFSCGDPRRPAGRAGTSGSDDRTHKIPEVCPLCRAAPGPSSLSHTFPCRGPTFCPFFDLLRARCSRPLPRARRLRASHSALSWRAMVPFTRLSSPGTTTASSSRMTRPLSAGGIRCTPRCAPHATASRASPPATWWASAIRRLR